MYKGDAFTKLGMNREAKDYLDISLKYNDKIQDDVDRKMLLSSIYTVLEHCMLIKRKEFGYNILPKSSRCCRGYTYK